MEKSEIQKVDQVIRAWLEDEPLMYERLLEVEALEALPQELGPLYKFLGRSRIHDGVLYLTFNSSVVRSQLSNNKAELLLRLNTAVGAELIRQIVFL
ncbi:DUF721 domain-containing protein [Porphyromonas gingivalis]|uniref:DUF721 domain-containing protein n=1 Tax=Porphyromonas gingivalis TaxID=837 RepID=UPI001F3E7A8C|nr:DUF721 domain-containing protein [Porphyromonas gingivalis]MCE8164275.1 DUF721 domain-containing protein [Porphyromonas gingivalis]MCE8179793.1 DUF721 domain-containing protein [Porphyromonas gingivalis]